MVRLKTYHRLPQRDMDIAVQQLLKQFLDDYFKGEFHVGQLLPSPRKLSELYNVTFSTARNLYTKLRQKGFIQTIPRKGTVLCCIPEPEAWGRKDLVRDGLTIIGILEYINPNAILNQTTQQLRTIDDLCNKNKIPARFYNLHKDLNKVLTADPVAITNDDIKNLKKQHAAGFIVMLTKQIHSEENIKQFKKLNAPVILINADSAVKGMITISCDEIESGAIAAMHLIKLKHQRIAFLGYDFPKKWQDDRILGYRKALKENGLIPIEKWSHFFPYKDPENLAKDCWETISQEVPKIFERCTAAICSSDTLSMLLLRYAHEHNIKPIALVSFDDHWKYRSWELSSIRYPIAEMAMKAFQLIQLSREKNNEDGFNCQIPGILYKRLSSFKCMPH